ncbi:MAG: hypothetical protein JWN48_5255 [Myxococcaceae bacterium]|nr:hypothetical protein [Myxococcaceae bacterium]
MDAAAPSKPAPASVELRPPPVPQDLAWLALGGGSDPLSNQISIAQDVELASSLFSGAGLTLFASGPGAQVSVQRDAARELAAGGDVVFRQLAQLLGPPGGLSVRYETATLHVDAPATRDLVLDVLGRALEGGLVAAGTPRTPLVVVASGHGERGESARQNALALWGGWPLDVRDLAAVLEAPEHARPTRFVITSCYGGGFAELAFLQANPQQGTRAADHCGLFAAPADDESSGCDPNPDRRAQESYSIHFLSALRGQDRAGRPQRQAIDLTGDARISLREAHAWARIHSRSFDIPTSTSERYLREFTRSFEQVRGAEDARTRELELDPEERSVVDALSAELELPDERRAREKLRELERILEEANAQVDEAQAGSDDSFYALRIALFERWPLLDHTWDPRAIELARREAKPIGFLLNESELAQGNAAAARELDDALSQQESVRVARARVLRLVRAFETLRLSGALKRRGGPRYEHYVALRECERFVPSLRE